MDFLTNFSEWLSNFLINAGVWAPVLSTILIYLEGILAFLPLVVFVTINVMTMGTFLGVIISWFFSVLGSYTMFLLTRKGFYNIFKRFIKNKKGITNLMQVISNLKFSQLVLINSFAFSPSFFINLGAGLADVPKKKYFYAILIGKIFDIIFLAYIGYNFVECFTNPYKIIEIIVLLLTSYIIARYINKKFKIDERY